MIWRPHEHCQHITEFYFVHSSEKSWPYIHLRENNPSLLSRSIYFCKWGNLPLGWHDLWEPMRTLGTGNSISSAVPYFLSSYFPCSLPLVLSSLTPLFFSLPLPSPAFQPPQFVSSLQPLITICRRYTYLYCYFRLLVNPIILTEISIGFFKKLKCVHCTPLHHWRVNSSFETVRWFLQTWYHNPWFYLPFTLLQNKYFVGNFLLSPPTATNPH